MIVKTLQLVALLALLVGGGYLLYPHATSLFAASCDKPLTYSIAFIDPRFGISETEVVEALREAEELWESAASRELFVPSEEGDIAISLVYGDEQRTNELGDVIDAEQSAYDAKKAELEGVKQKFNKATRAFDTASAAFDTRAAAYHAEVTKWNSKGGAPPAEYERLQEEQKELEAARSELTRLAERVNEYAALLNTAVDELNALASVLNTRVARYNERAGDAFDQGDYQEDQAGKRISVYEFSDGTDLRRVLAHEFGHALTIGHVEDPGSLMYSFNAGSELQLSEADVAALRTACRLD
jgi:hypothetical protein